MKDIIDNIQNEDNQDRDVVTLSAANGKEIDFFEIAGIVYNGNFYAILQPVELLEGMRDDDAMVFRVLENEDGEDTFNIELDDEVIEAVFEEYQKLYDSVVGNSDAD